MDRTKRIPRRFDAVQDVQRSHERQLGMRTQAEQDLLLDVEARAGGGRFRGGGHLQFTLGPFHRENLASVGDATYSLRLPVPDSPTTYNSTSAGVGVVMPDAGRVVAGLFVLSGDLTAGQVRLVIRLDGVSAITLDACSCIATDTIKSSASFRVAEHELGFAFAKGQLLGLALNTAGVTPATLEGTAWVLVSLDR